MTQLDLNHAIWRKSSRSQGATQCVEVASLGAYTAVRDSKNPAGPALVLPSDAFRELLRAIRAGQFG